MAKAAGIIAGLLVVAGACYLLLPRMSTGAGRVPEPERARTPREGLAGPPPPPERPLRAPRPAEEVTRDEFSRKRLPFYRFLRERYSGEIRQFGVTENLDTLDLEVAKTDDEFLRRIVSEAVSPTAGEYGFRKVRFFVANPPGSVDPVTLIAESTYDGAGRWNTFRK